MPAPPAFIMGLMIGAILTLLVQAFGRRKARQAIAAHGHGASAANLALREESGRQTAQIDRLNERIAILERITTDPAERTAREIEALRNR